MQAATVAMPDNKNNLTQRMKDKNNTFGSVSYAKDSAVQPIKLASISYNDRKVNETW